MRRDIKIDEIRALIALVDGGSLVNAAAIIGRTESALSLQLKRLEQSAGAALLEKKGRRLVLTEAGRVVLDRGRRMIAAQEELRNLACPREATGPVNAAGCGHALPASLLPANGVTLHAPVRVTLSAEGQFRGMRPVQSFRQSLAGPFLRAAYDYWMARSRRSEAVDLDALPALAERCGARYVVALIRLAPDQAPELAELAFALGGGPKGFHAGHRSRTSGLLARRCPKASALLRHAHRIETPIAWSGGCMLEGHQRDYTRYLALPLCREENDCAAVLLVSEVSPTEHYHLPAGQCDTIPAPEMVMVSTDDQVALPTYHLKYQRTAERQVAETHRHAA